MYLVMLKVMDPNNGPLEKPVDQLSASCVFFSLPMAQGCFVTQPHTPEASLPKIDPVNACQHEKPTTDLARVLLVMLASTSS